MTRILSFCILAFVASFASAASLLVLNKEDATLSIFDPATGRQRGANIPVGAGPHEVEVSGDGSLAFVGNYGTAQAPGNSLSVIDLRAARERTRVDLGDLRRPHGLAVQGQSVYFTAEDAQHVARYDAATNRVDWRFGTGQQRTHMVLVARDRSVITANIQSDNVSFITPQAGSGTQVLVAVGKGPEGMDLTPDGRQLWTANSGDGSVSIVDVATRKLVKTFDIGTKRSNRLKFTPDGTVALVSDLTAGELLVIDVRTQAVKARLPIGRGASGILVAPDGSRAYVAAASEGKLVIVDAKNWRIAGEIRTGRGPDGMAWVP
jgi:YVTN family beta-propeller protein